MNSTKLYPFYIFFIFSFIYALGSFDRIPFGDCVGFVSTTDKGEFVKTSTPVDHFLYINTAIFIKAITGFNGILASKLLVIISASLSVVIVYFTSLLTTKKHWVAIVSAFVFGFSFTFWRNAEIVEVYTYHTFWCALIFYFIIKTFLHEKKKKKNIIFAGLLLAISLWSHIENILLIPAFFVFLLIFRKHKTALYLGIIFLIISILGMTLLNAQQNLPFKSIYSTGQGKWVENSFKKSLAEYFTDLIKSVFILIYNFNIFVIPGVLGCIYLFKSNKPLFYVAFVAGFFIYGFSTFYAVSDNYVFFLPFNLLFIIAIALGLSNSKMESLFKKWSPLCLLIPVFYLMSFQVISMTSFGKNIDDFKSYKGGLRYYALPWMNDNVGILEFTIEKRKALEPMGWMTLTAEEYIRLLKTRGYTEQEIKEF